jgi:hypothetical protein
MALVFEKVKKLPFVGQNEDMRERFVNAIGNKTLRTQTSISAAYWRNNKK